MTNNNNKGDETLTLGLPQGYAPTRWHNVKITTTILFILLLTTSTNYAWAQIDINNPSNGTGYTWNSTTLTITENGTYTITGTTTTNCIMVNPSLTEVNITLSDANIDVSATSNACAFDMTDATVNLTLTGNNSLKSSGNKAGLQVPSGATLNINLSTGSLTATGGNIGGAGIGGGEYGAGGTINISGGTVTANGGDEGAGIGGGSEGDGGSITISAGNVTATGGERGAGIGGGYNADGGTINITGGNVTATGGAYYAAGIGGGSMGNGGIINISGGTVTATGGSYTPSGASFSGAGIGGGQEGNGGTITISGGTVTATGGCSAAGIGGGDGGNGGIINITGGTVTATGGSYRYDSSTNYSGAGIGGGNNGNGGTINISGGTIIATRGSSGTAMDIGKGGGSSASDGTLTINGGSVYATSVGAPPKNSNSTSIYLNTLTVGSNLNANTAITAGSINGVPCVDGEPTPPAYGIKDVVTDDDGKVYFWLPTTDTEEAVELETTGGTVYGATYTRNDENNAATLALKYGITLDQTTYSFPDATYGYTAQSPLDVTVTNTGYMPTGALTVTLTGAHGTAFILSATSITDIAADDDTTFTVAPDTGLSAATYTATVNVTGTGDNDNDISATFDVSFTVLPRNINAEDITLTFTGDTVYTGSRLTPSFTVDDNSATITEDDYEVSWAENIQCSTGGTVTLTGQGNYTGSLTRSFTILRRDISSAIITLTGDTVYTGSQLTPAFTVDDSEATISSADYTVSTWGENIEVSTGGNVTLNGQGNYTGSLTHTFNILPRNIANATIIITGDTVYTGSQLTPDFEVIDNEVTITEADYTVSWGENVQCSTGGTVSLTGQGNCTGSLIHTFTISKAPLYATAADTSRVYGDPNPEFTVTYAGFVNGDNELVITAPATATSDADNTSSVGGYTINVSVGDASNYDLLPVSGTLTITPRSISPVVLTVTGDTVYTGSQLQPDFEVIDSEATITNADYTVSWGDNVQCRTGGTVTLTGTNNYTGSVTQAFHIDKAIPTTQALHYTIPEELIYDGNPHPVEVEVRTEVTPVTQQPPYPHTALRTTADAEPLTVKYNGYTDLIPRNAGNYHITVDIPEQPNYINIANLDLGSLEILKRTPDTLCFDYNIEDIPFYDGLPHPVNTDALDTIDGLGEVTVLYDGYKQVPVYPGTYEVALSIAEGLNYDALPYLRLGSYTIPNPPPMPTLMRTVRFISIPEGAAISPFSIDRIHYHINGNDLTFTLITGTQHLGLTPVVSTAEPFKSTLSYIDILPNDSDSTYTVIIYRLRENVDILISFTSADGNIPFTDNDLVWSTGKHLLIKSNQDALARIYSPGGSLIQTITLQAGKTTQITLPTGFYIVTLNNKFYKVLVTH